jgi:hypothetical protein
MALTPEEIQSYRKKYNITPQSTPTINVEDRMNRYKSLKVEPQKEGLLEGAISAVGGFFKGAVKGVGKTLTTVPESIEKVARAGIEVKKGVETQESIAKSFETNLELFRRARKETDPEKKEKLLEQAEKTFRELSPIAREEAEVPRVEVIEKAEDILKPKGLAERIGFGAEKLAEFFIPSGAIRKAEVGITKGLVGLPKIVGKPLEIAGRSIAEGASAGLVVSAQGEELGDIGKTALLTSLFSAPLKAFGVIKGDIAKTLKAGAEKKAAQALAPTTKEMKRKAEKVIPELLKRRVKFLTLEGLESKAQKGIDSAGDVLSKAYAELPEGTRVAISPVIENLEKLKSQLVIKGTNTVPESAMSQWSALAGVQDELLSLAKGAENTISIGSLRSYRQILDNLIQKAGKGFGLTGSETANLASQKAMANSIRNELAKKFPNIAKINKEYSFWSNVKEITKTTIERRKPQSGLINQLAGLTGVGAGAISGGVSGALGFGAVLSLLSKAVRSAGWRQLSAITRNKIAEGLAKDSTKIADVLSKIIAGQTYGFGLK